MTKKKSIRYESSIKILGWPLVSIATGPDRTKGEKRGWARGIIAIGDLATGVIAVGGLAAGGVSVGGVSVGAVSVGGVSLGGLILAGVAIGYATFGGVAIGHYAKGGAAVGAHVVSPHHRDPEAVRFFNSFIPGANAAEVPDQAKVDH